MSAERDKFERYERPRIIDEIDLAENPETGEPEQTYTINGPIGAEPIGVRYDASRGVILSMFAPAPFDLPDVTPTQKRRVLIVAAGVSIPHPLWRWRFVGVVELPTRLAYVFLERDLIEQIADGLGFRGIM